MSKDHDVQAFPVSDQGVHGTYGMTLRDYFAAKAMQGLISAHDSEGQWRGCEDIEERLALIAYLVADAMLKARK